MGFRVFASVLEERLASQSQSPGEVPPGPAVVCELPPPGSTWLIGSWPHRGTAFARGTIG